MTCSGDWEIRQPQDYVHGVADIQAPPFTRAESANRFYIPDGANLLNIFSAPTVTIGIKFILYSSSKQEVNASSINSKTVG